MSYPRTASAHSQFTGQSTGQSTGQAIHPPTQLPVRSRTNGSLSFNSQPFNSQPFNSQPTPQIDAQRAPNPASPAPQTFTTRHRSITSKKAVWIGISAIALSLLTIIPARVGSESIHSSHCEKKIKPTGEISRGQMTALLALPAGAKKAAVRQVVAEPYCTLPAVAQPAPDEQAKGNDAIAGAEREAYPLAFDPEAWVVIAYSQTGEYVGYDFVFNP
ncbi:MAG: hypothetical protein WA947_06065 [Phormidesmis sp.]